MEIYFTIYYAAVKEFRKVQKVGYSTLVVSLPSRWARERGLKQGNVVTITEESGSLRLEAGVQERKGDVVCTVNADLCQKPQMLARIITGCYLLGYGTITITSFKELRPEQLEEIQVSTKRLPGLEMVEQTLRRVVIQSFVDPTRFPVEGLVRRLHVMVTTMLNSTISAFLEQRPDLVEQVIRMEREIDEIYWLIVRQLLLSLADREIGERIGIQSPNRAVGDRLVVKTMEEIADFLEAIVKETPSLQRLDGPSAEQIRLKLKRFGEQVLTVLGKTMKAFFTRDILLANEVLESVKQVVVNQRALTEEILALEPRPEVASALRAVIGGLSQIARYYEIIAEITINRFLTQSSKICTIERSQR